MGLSKILGVGEDALRTSTVCGTRAYLAPEMILRKPYGLSVDFWQFGCFVFELYAVRRINSWLILVLALPSLWCCLWASVSLLPFLAVPVCVSARARALGRGMIL